MKIASSQQNLASSHLEANQRSVSERLRSWTGNRPPAEGRARNQLTQPTQPTPPAPGAAADSAPTRISTDAQALANALSALPTPVKPTPLPAAQPMSDAALAAPESSAIAAAMDDSNNDPSLALLRSMLERVFGIHVRTFDAAELSSEHSASQDLQLGESGTIARGEAGWGVDYEYHAEYTETEYTRFSASGMVTTQDGQTFEFELSLEMSRRYSERIDLAYRAGDAVRLKDPLVLNFAGNAAQLSDLRFEIDLDDDGDRENARFAAPGSGFLVFDRNGDGKVNSGKELFGPTSGDGFAELAALDHDHNGWIDENDPIYGKLKVWTKNADGSETLQSLKDSKVGAISLARLATPFALRDGANTPLGQVRNSGIYLADDGSAGTVQQVDLAV